MALGFALPTLLRVGRVPPLRVLRRELDAPGLAGWLVWVLAAAVFVGLMYWQVQDQRLAGGMALALYRRAGRADAGRACCCCASWRRCAGPGARPPWAWPRWRAIRS